jgi:four helix bundle protein
VKVKSYADLDVWRKGMDLVVEVYEATARFPKEEVFGLTAQLRRAAVSVPSNIAEGRARKSRAEFLHHLSFAHGSLAELETHVLIAERLRYLQPARSAQLMGSSAEVGRMLNGLYNALSTKRT